MRLLFVCTGNTCRSPMAEAICRHDAAARGLDVEVGSAGTHAEPGDPAAENAVAVAAEHGLDLAAHRSRLATDELLAGADRVYTMRELGIADPYGGTLDDYRRTFAELEAAVAGILDDLEAGP